MILSKDTQGGTKKKPTVVPGERTKATTFFNNKAEIPATLQATLRNATVHIDYGTGQGVGSGVILNAGAGNKAYVLTAKHILYIFAGKKPDETKPADLVTDDFLGKLKIYYAPPALPSKAASQAAVSAVKFLAEDDQTWSYDVMALEIDNAGFRTHVANNRFLPAAVVNTYTPLFKVDNKTQAVGLLDKNKYIYVQLGYGAGRDPDVKATENYEDLKGQLQCRWPEPTDKTILKSAFEVTGGKVAPDSEDLCMLTASDLTSTGTGDSGGPLFAIPKEGKQRTTAYLVGVTTGANFLTDDKYKQNPSTAPKDDTIRNNVSTCWDRFYLEWAW